MKKMTSYQRRVKWETVFLLDYLEKQRRLSPQLALAVCRLAVVVLHELPPDRTHWDIGASMTMNRGCFEEVR
jgi:hypothetical protein